MKLGHFSYCHGHFSLSSCVPTTIRARRILSRARTGKPHTFYRVLLHLPVPDFLVGLHPYSSSTSLECFFFFHFLTLKLLPSHVVGVWLMQGSYVWKLCAVRLALWL